MASMVRPFLMTGITSMRRIFHYLVNNIREHFMLYIILWSLLAIMDVIYIMFF
ncbi:hypothetical protein HMPREF3212_03006 [Citrobacter freundii]|nr:hypothetical protein HMPREF3212_03006 [Citrobacter freundii]